MGVIGIRWLETQKRRTGRALAFGFATCLTLFVLVLVAFCTLPPRRGRDKALIHHSLVVMEDKNSQINQLWDGIHEYIL